MQNIENRKDRDKMIIFCVVEIFFIFLRYNLSSVNLTHKTIISGNRTRIISNNS